MSRLGRAVAVGGLILLAASFFLPPGFYNSPRGRFSWSFQAVSLSETFGEMLAFSGICLVIVYPYFWALLTAIFLLRGRSDRRAVRFQFICHLAGGLPITAIGLALLLSGSDFPVPAVQWIAALVPAGFILLLLAGAIFASPARRLPVLAAGSLLLFSFLQAILLYSVWLDGGSWWGYLLGAGGAVSALFGIVFGLFRSGRRT